MKKVAISNPNRIDSRLKAIDLYSGIGGWSLGLRMAGIEVVSSYEWWSPAANTQQMNLGEGSVESDIRKLELADLPSDIDLVVGSPPCTQFSYSNRGGSGDIADGLMDLSKFLKIVEHISPRFWMMENVPRVASVLESELSPGGQLERFRELVENIDVVDCSLLGLPQRRKRMIAGSFPQELLRSYMVSSPRRSLGSVISSLQKESPEDPVYGNTLAADQLTENDYEDELGDEELKLNRESKQFHRIYNIMPFPEPLERASRTITAAETRVSRESLIVGVDGRQQRFRRLTLRERASLQGFPITYQFYGSTYSNRQKMIGNAIPPLLTYYLGRAVQGTPAENVHIMPVDYQHPLPDSLPDPVSSRTKVPGFREDRRFRSAIPNLRFGSGVRFELSNEFIGGEIRWKIQFYFGGSKTYQHIEPDAAMADALVATLNAGVADFARDEHDKLKSAFGAASATSLQRVWNHRSEGGIGPFDVVDAVGNAVARIHEKLVLVDSSNSDSNRIAIINALNGRGEMYREFGSDRKFRRIHQHVLIGTIIAGWFNSLDLVATISPLRQPVEA